MLEGFPGEEEEHRREAVGGSTPITARTCSKTGPVPGPTYIQAPLRQAMGPGGTT